MWDTLQQAEETETRAIASPPHTPSPGGAQLDLRTEIRGGGLFTGSIFQVWQAPRTRSALTCLREELLLPHGPVIYI